MNASLKTSSNYSASLVYEIKHKSEKTVNN